MASREIKAGPASPASRDLRVREVSSANKDRRETMDPPGIQERMVWLVSQVNEETRDPKGNLPEDLREIPAPLVREAFRDLRAPLVHEDLLVLLETPGLRVTSEPGVPRVPQARTPK